MRTTLCEAGAPPPALLVLNWKLLPVAAPLWPVAGCATHATRPARASRAARCSRRAHGAHAARSARSACAARGARAARAPRRRRHTIPSKAAWRGLSPGSAWRWTVAQTGCLTACQPCSRASTPIRPAPAAHARVPAPGGAWQRLAQLAAICSSTCSCRASAGGALVNPVAAHCIASSAAPSPHAHPRARARPPTNVDLDCRRVRQCARLAGGAAAHGTSCTAVPLRRP